MPEIALTQADRQALRPVLIGKQGPPGVRKGTWWRLTVCGEDNVYEGLDVLQPRELRALMTAYPEVRTVLDLT